MIPNDIQIQCNSNQSPSKIIIHIHQPADSQICKVKASDNSQHNTEEQSWRAHTTDLKTYSKVTIIKAMWH